MMILRITTLVLAGSCWLVELAIAQVDNDRFIYRSPDGIEFEVTDLGLSTIRTNDRILAHGGWSAWIANNWFTTTSDPNIVSKSDFSKTLSIKDPNNVQVKHAGEKIACEFDYRFSGDDLTIRARVENLSDDTIEATGFSGLTFEFDRLPTGLMMNQHITYLQSHGSQICHPSFWSRIGGSYAVDSSIGVGISPWGANLEKTLILWDFTDWEPDKRDQIPSRKPIYFVVDKLPSGGSHVYELHLRVSQNRDWQHLLEPYRDYFQMRFGTIQYETDPRWISTDYLNGSLEDISSKNPYGLQAGKRRIDTVDGAKKFCERHIEALQTNDGQGTIVWGHTGEDPRGAMYRPDFDVIPPPLEKNIEWIAKQFVDAGLKFGICTRPRDLAVRESWETDSIIEINPESTAHREMIWKRYKKMISLGCTLFYLDSFGDNLHDVNLMRYLRQQLGPHIQTYCEHQCDAIFPYSGGYSECTLDATDPSKAAYQIWTGNREWEIYQWLTPSAQLAVRLYQTKGQAPSGFESPDRFFLRHRTTPLVPSNALDRASSLKLLQAEFQIE